MEDRGARTGTHVSISIITIKEARNRNEYDLPSLAQKHIQAMNFEFRFVFPILFFRS